MRTSAKNHDEKISQCTALRVPFSFSLFIKFFWAWFNSSLCILLEWSIVMFLILHCEAAASCPETTQLCKTFLLHWWLQMKVLRVNTMYCQYTHRASRVIGWLKRACEQIYSLRYETRQLQQLRISWADIQGKSSIPLVCRL